MTSEAFPSPRQAPRTLHRPNRCGAFQSSSRSGAPPACPGTSQTPWFVRPPACRRGTQRAPPRSLPPSWPAVSSCAGTRRVACGCGPHTGCSGWRAPGAMPQARHYPRWRRNVCTSLTRGAALPCFLILRDSGRMRASRTGRAPHCGGSRLRRGYWRTRVGMVAGCAPRQPGNDPAV